MSTKVTITHGPSFHLYSDALERAFDDTDQPPSHVYLELKGVHVQIDTTPEGGPTIVLRLPRGLAEEVGLLAAPNP